MPQTLVAKQLEPYAADFDSGMAPAARGNCEEPESSRFLKLRYVRCDSQEHEQKSSSERDAMPARNADAMPARRAAHRRYLCAALRALFSK